MHIVFDGIGVEVKGAKTLVTRANSSTRLKAKLTNAKKAQ